MMTGDQDSGDSDPMIHVASAADLRLVEALRRGDEAAFAALVDRYHGAMVRLARLHVKDVAVAEEVAQEAWLGVLQGLRRFEARSSLKTWIFRILINCAKTRGQRESRSSPFSSLSSSFHYQDDAEPAVAPDRFDQDAMWSSHPHNWNTLPEQTFLSNETQARTRVAIAALPPMQQEVVTLRDIEGWPADEVCSSLGISEANQRVLLHRARSKVRSALEQYFDEAVSVAR
jgi:RNA polymerase sigma-70 factor, ECF subfamily